MAEARPAAEDAGQAETGPTPLRPSLLQPGRFAHRLDDLDRFLLVFLYLVALALRWDLRTAQPYLAESWHYYTAVHLWDSVSNVVVDAGRARLDLSWFFWQRPLLSLPFHWFATQSFETYRAAHIVAVSSVPPLGLWLLRSLGTARGAALAAASVLAVHPLLLPWGVMVFPDSLVLALLLAALLAAHHGRPAATALLLLAGAWVKEVAVVAAVTLLALALWRDADGRRARAWPFRLGAFARWLMPVVPLALLPLWASLQMPGALFPGFRAGGSTAESVERLFLLVWIVPLALLGLRHAATRRFTLVAMAWPAFFLLYHLLLDKALEFWYYVIPASFTALAAAAGIDAEHRNASRVLVRRSAIVAGLAALALVWVQVSVPVERDLNRAVATPLTGQGQWDLARVQSFELTRDRGLAGLLALPGPDEREAWIAVDFEVSYLYHPLAPQATAVFAASSVPERLPQGVVQQWQAAIERETNVTVLVERDDLADNSAVRAAYAECSVRAWPFVLIRAKDCQGAGDDLWEQYQSARLRLQADDPAAAA